jgi:hypothetical protein
VAATFSAPLPPTRSVGDTGPAGDANLFTGAINEVRSAVSSIVTTVATSPFDNTGATDCTAAIQAAINAISATGGTIVFPPGTYKIAGQLNLNSSYNVALAGTSPQGADRIGPWDTTLLFTKTGSTACITARASQGFTLANLAVIASNSAYTGSIVDVGSPGDPTPTYRPTFRGGYIGGPGTTTVTANSARAGINLGQVVEAVIENMVFGRTQYGVIGRSSTEAGFSNAVIITGGRFVDMQIASILNPGFNWTIIGTVFENVLSGAAAGIVCTSAYPAQALSLFGASFWDNSATGIWIDFWGSGLNINGSYAEVNSGATFVRLNGTVNGFRSVGGTIKGASSSKYLALANSPLVTAAETGDAFFGGMGDNTGALGGSIAFNAAYQPTLRRRALSTPGTVQLGLLDCGSLILCDATAGQILILMPDPTSSPGSTIIVKKSDTSTNTVVPNGFPLTGQNAARSFVSDGTAWHTTSIVPAH